MHNYLFWNQQTITDFSSENITTLYDQGYVFTRKEPGAMDQTRSTRIDLSVFELSSENRRILRKTEGLNIKHMPLPYTDYHWSIGKLAKDFYDTKFEKGTFSANKVKELLTSHQQSNFNTLFQYTISNEAPTEEKSLETVGYAICHENEDILHYSYPFYTLNSTPYPSLGMGMMLRAIEYAKASGKKYIYLGSAQRPTDKYKLQFKGLEWFDENQWSTDEARLKTLLKQINTN